MNVSRSQTIICDTRLTRLSTTSLSDFIIINVRLT